MPVNKFVSGGVEQVHLIQLTFSDGSSIKVYGAYHTDMHIIFEFLRYVRMRVPDVFHVRKASTLIRRRSAVSRVLLVLWYME